MALIQSLPALAARIPANLHAKLLASFLLMVGLLLVMGVISLQVISQDNRRVEELVLLQNKLAAYRQLQSDSTEQLYNITSALLVPDAQTLDAALQHMRQFGYDFERLQFVTELPHVLQDY